MLSSTNTSSSSIINYSSVSCWPVLEPALNQLFPPSTDLTAPSTLGSDEYLKLYTAVFEHCVGSAEGKKAGVKTAAVGLNISGEELYMTLVKYLETRLNQWSQYLMTEVEKNPYSVLNLLLCQLDRLQAAEKPLTFIFTYLERHWIDRQINEPRPDILPMKQLIWSTWDKIVLEKVFRSTALVLIDGLLNGVRSGQVGLEDLGDLAKFVHYLRVISKPTQLESDYKATRRVTMAGAVVNPRAVHQDRFKDFVQAYCDGIQRDCPKMTDNVHEFVQIALQFWNEEEGRMAFLRFDKSAQVTVRNHLKSLILLPHIDSFKSAFKASIVSWNSLAANAIYHLLANRKSLLVNLDSESEIAFIEKGQELIATEMASHQQQADDMERLFISLIGQFYNMVGELIQTSFASRSEIFEARSKAFRSLLNHPPGVKHERMGFTARSLARFADYIVRNFPDSTGDNLSVVLALFRLIDDKEEFLDAYGKLLALRLLTGVTRLPSTFEHNLLSEFKQICGPFYVKSFEKMFSDLTERETSVTVLTGGTWNIRGKLLPGHAALLGANETDFNWPEPLKTEITGKTKNYHQKYPKRKLFWSPLLTSVEFDYSLNSISVAIRGTCLHLKMLEMISEGSKVDSEIISKTFGQFSTNVLSSLRTTGLISDSSDGCLIINQNFKPEAKDIDLYTLTLTDLLSTGKNGGVTLSSQSTSSTPLPSKYFTSNTPSHQVQISPIDKSILLQCAITRILKQLRLLGLTDLFNRISMLPKLLTRFSPSIKDVLDALKQLHEKEFVKLAFGHEIDDLIEFSDEDLSNIYNENQIYVNTPQSYIILNTTLTMWSNKLENPNSTWLSLRGTWLTNILIAMVLKIAFSILPGVTPEISWTLTNLTYNISSFFFLHWLLGTPFDVNQNEYYALTLWEQLDDGTQYTPNRKFLTLFPIILFLLSAHYSHYDITLFTINIISLLIVLIAKLPQLHRVRIFGINKRE